MTQPIDQTWTLFLSRSFQAPREDVFECFTSVEQMKQWFGPSCCHVTDGEMDFRVGGKYKLKLQTQMGEVCLEGEFTEIEAPLKLACTWKWTENEMFNSIESFVSYEFTEENGQTTIAMTHSGLETEESRDHHHVGWSGSFDKLFLNAMMRLTGRIGWNEIATQDAQKTQSFYCDLLGWQTIEMPVGDMTYVSFAHQGQPIAGINPLPPESAEVPSHWVNYINVADIEGTVAKAKELGATVMMEPKSVGGLGSMAVLQDPTGAEFSLWECAKKD